VVQPSPGVATAARVPRDPVSVLDAVRRCGGFIASFMFETDSGRRV
jgi:hypothetical protein